jgi:hypothetical protein
MSTEGAKERWEHKVSHPYEPDLTTGGDPAVRIANAMEYIAAQLGQINAKLDRVLKS